MSLGLRDQKEARRRRWRFFRFVLYVAFLLFLAFAAYRSGSLLAERETFRLQNEVEQLTATVESLRSENSQLRQEAEAAALAASQWQDRYEAEVPTGKERELLALIREQVEQGADPARIEFLIGTAARDQACEGQAATKRFLMRTPLYEGASDAVTFADGAIVVTGQGASATDAEGNPEAWFDAAKPVTIRFVQPGGEASEATGVLPLHHSLVRGDSEYRFSIVAAERRGFVTATAERCAFP